MTLRENHVRVSVKGPVKIPMQATKNHLGRFGTHTHTQFGVVVATVREKWSQSSQCKIGQQETTPAVTALAFGTTFRDYITYCYGLLEI